ncbi:MAG: thioredoxin-like protein [Monoraphidium minutum]|nr:MAG: thioredoxin-like protein [Monoraphidium minutum]
MAPPTLYVDMMSQPSRAVVIFCRLNKLPVEVRLVRLDKGEHRQPWFLELNPLAKVPLLVDGPLRLPESPAILLYLADRFGIPNHWAPRWPGAAAGGESSGGVGEAGDAAAAAAAARFQSALSWQGSALRGAAMQLLFHRVVGRVFGAAMVPEVAATGLAALRAALRDMERYWLRAGAADGGGAGSADAGGGGGGFLAGREVSVADVLAACEVEQLSLLDADPSGPGMQQLLADRPATHAWLERVRAACAPEWDAAHATVRAAAAAMARRGKGGAHAKL